MIVLSRNNPKGIIWIASYPRSGNTWTRAFINALGHVIRDPNFGDIDINKIEEGSAAESKAELYTQILGKPAHRATDAEIAAVRPRVQAGIVKSLGRPVFIKTHNANAMDHGFPIINMAVSAGAVYIVRNPLDVAISFAAFSGTTVDQVIKSMATPGWGVRTSRENVRIVTGSWSENVGSWTGRPHPAVLVVRYEDLVADPAKHFGSVARHLLMTPTDEQLAKAIDLTGFERLRAKEAVAGFVERPDTTNQFFRAGRPGQWREKLTEEQVAKIVTAHKPLMRRFGYLPEGM
ncbi:MAG TPA: sulfotransferase domain-containing protein [Bauldia sp.]|nr:sulfotransferase domain-containing protein [Bauldia sp.]